MQHVFLGIGVLYPIIVVEFGLSFTQLGIVIASTTVTSGFLQLLFSILSRYKAKKILLGAGGILMGLGSFATGLAFNFTHLIGARVLAGVGTAPQHPIGTTIISEKFKSSSRGGAIGMHFGLAYIGNIVGPLAMISIAATMGWRMSMYLLAIPAIVIGIAIIILLESEVKSAEAVGIKSSLKQDMADALKIKGAVVVIAAQAFTVGGTGQGAIINFIPIFLTNRFSLGVFEAGLIFTFILVGGVLGPLIIGRISDKVGRIKTAFFAAVSSSALVYLLIFHEEANLLLIINLFIMALSSFSISSILQAHLADISEASVREMLMGLFFTIGFGFSSLWATVMGYLLDIYKSFAPPFTLMSILILFASFLLLTQIKSTSAAR